MCIRDSSLASVALLLSVAAPVVEVVRLQNQTITLEGTPELGGRGLSFSLNDLSLIHI